LLDYAKLAEGSGLSVNKVRKAVKWLIDNKKIEARKVFGNKRRVRLPAEAEELRGQELPTESYFHVEPAGDDPTESYPHNS